MPCHFLSLIPYSPGVPRISGHVSFPLLLKAKSFCIELAWLIIDRPCPFIWLPCRLALQFHHQPSRRSLCAADSGYVKTQHVIHRDGLTRTVRWWELWADEDSVSIQEKKCHGTFGPHPSPEAQEHHEKRKWRDYKIQRFGRPGIQECLLDRMGLLHTWTHRNWRWLHKTHTMASQVTFQQKWERGSDEELVTVNGC